MERWRPFFDYSKSKVGDWVPCKQCGKSFKKPNYNSIYCSHECQQAAQVHKARVLRYPEGAPQEEVREAGGMLWLVVTQDPLWPTKPCNRCGRPTHVSGKPPHNVPAFCSDKCRELAKEARVASVKSKHPPVAGTYPPRRCEWCGKEFTPLYRSGRCCCHDCSNKNAARKRELRGGTLAYEKGDPYGVENPCVICGGALPEGYVVHEACTKLSKIRFDALGIYKPGDKPKPFIYCANCGGFVEKGEKICHSCGFRRYNDKDKRFK